MNFVVENVEEIEDGADYGEYSDLDNAIRLASTIKDDKDKVRTIKLHTKKNTFFHELIHVFQYYFNTKYDEAQAQVYANFLMEFFQTAEYHEETND